MSNKDGFKLSRRKALAGIGGIGVASAGAGLGTSAYFSDQESFDNNTITAGELDLRIDWQQLYWGMEYDHDQALYGSAGRPFVNAHPDHDGDGMQSLDLDEFDEGEFGEKDYVASYVDGDPGDDMNWSKEDVEDGANIQEYLTCETLDNFDDPSDFSNDNDYNPDSLIHLEDVKPGDCGEVTFSYHLCDNPGYVWLLGQLGEIDEELAEAIEVSIWYDLNCNNVFDDDQDRLIFEWGSMAELLPYLSNGLQLNPGAYGDTTVELENESEDTESTCVKVGKIDDVEGGVFEGVDGGTKTDNDNEFNFNKSAPAPPWSGDGDYEEKDATVKIDITEFKDRDEDEPVSFTAEVTDGEFGLCRIRVNGGRDTETFYDLGAGDEACVTETREIQTDLRNPGGQRAGISNIEFFVCETDDDVPSTNFCFPADETYCVGFKWCLPVDIDAEEIDGIGDINDLQGKSVKFDLGFYTEQCRHNDDPDSPSELN